MHTHFALPWAIHRIDWSGDTVSALRLADFPRSDPLLDHGHQEFLMIPMPKRYSECDGYEKYRAATVFVELQQCLLAITVS